MDKTQTLQRLELLYLILQFCSYEQEKGRQYIFNPGERIAINQERGSRFENLSFLHGEFQQNEVRTAQVSEFLEDKINMCLGRIMKENWKGYPQSHFIENLKNY